MNWGWGKDRRRCRALSDKLFFPECRVPQDVLQRVRGSGWITEGQVGCVLMSGPTILLVWGLCMCVCPPLPRSPYTPRRSTTWTCTRTWWFVWLWWCHSPVHSTWPHSHLFHVMSYCRPAQLCPGSLCRRTEELSNKNWRWFTLCTSLKVLTILLFLLMKTINGSHFERGKSLPRTNQREINKQLSLSQMGAFVILKLEVLVLRRGVTAM